MRGGHHLPRTADLDGCPEYTVVVTQKVTFITCVQCTHHIHVYTIIFYNKKIHKRGEINTHTYIHVHEDVYMLHHVHEVLDKIKLIYLHVRTWP